MKREEGRATLTETLSEWSRSEDQRLEKKYTILKVVLIGALVVFFYIKVESTRTDAFKSPEDPYYSPTMMSGLEQWCWIIFLAALGIAGLCYLNKLYHSESETLRDTQMARREKALGKGDQ